MIAKGFADDNEKSPKKRWRCKRRHSGNDNANRHHRVVPQLGLAEAQRGISTRIDPCLFQQLQQSFLLGTFPLLLRPLLFLLRPFLLNFPFQLLKIL